MDSQTIKEIALAGVHGNNDLLIVAIVMVSIVLIVVPAIFFDYRMKSRRSQAAQESGATQARWDTARRMEARIGYLETVLDTEVPGWRSRSEIR